MDVAEQQRRLTGPWAAVRRHLLVGLGAALPLLTVFTWLCLLYGWEAWGTLTAWVVPDEFERVQLSRAIAATGHAAQRTVPHSFDTLYVYVIAPAWWIGNTSRAYGLVKSIGVVTMTSVVFPTYLLARMLVSRPWALFAAAGAAMIPTLAYSSLLMLEPLAYLWAALCFYLLAKALVVRTRGWVAGAAVACLLAPAMRGELAVIIVGAPLATFVFWFAGEAGGRLRGAWTRLHWIGFAALAIALVIAADVMARHADNSWRIATAHRDLMLTYGIHAAGALTIGLGVLPTVAGLCALVKTSPEPLSREQRAFVSLTVTMLAAFSLYTAGKAAVLAVLYSSSGQPLLTERNLIYVAPLLFVGTATVCERGRPKLPTIVASTAAAIYLVIHTPYLIGYEFFFDAPGLSVLQALNRDAALSPRGARYLLIGIALGCLVVLTCVHLLRRARASVFIAVVACLVLAWNAYGEVNFAHQSHLYSVRLLDNMPRPLNWIDRAVPRHATVYYLGQSVDQSVPFGSVELLEFWNRSLQHVWSLDGSAPGPGPTAVPNVISRDGRLEPGEGARYVLTDFGIALVGRVLETKSHFGGGGPTPWTLYQVAPPLRIRRSVEGIYSDGWGRPDTAFNQYSIAGNRRSRLRISVSRLNGGKTLPVTVQIKVGKLELGSRSVGFRQQVTGPVMGKVLFTRTLHVRHELDHRFTFTAPPAPFRVETTVTAFTPRDVDPRSSDARELGAEISYATIPMKKGRAG